MSRRKEPAIPDDILDQLLAGGAASAAFEQGGLLDSLKKALTERALNAEMDHHLAGDDGAGNTRRSSPVVCREHRLAAGVRSGPTAHRKTKRNQTSQRLLAGTLNHDLIEREVPLLGPEPNVLSGCHGAVPEGGRSAEIVQRPPG